MVDFDEATAKAPFFDVRDEIAQLFERGVSKVVVNCSQIPGRVDNTAVAGLTYRRSRMQQAGGNMHFCCMTLDLRNFIENVLEYGDGLKYFDTEAEAVQAFATGAASASFSPEELAKQHYEEARARQQALEGEPSRRRFRKGDTYWEVDLDKGVVLTETGGELTEKRFATYAEARTEHDRLVQEQLQAGFVEVALDEGFDASPPVAEATLADLRSLWDRLRRALEQHAPSVAANLSPPATEAAIAAAERELRLRLPEDLRAAYLVHDGQPDDIATLLSGYRWMPLSAVVYNARSMRFLAGPEYNEEETWWSLAWVPIASLGNGDYYCVDTADGRVIGFCHEEGDRPAIDPSFRDLLNDLADRLEQGRLTYAEDEGWEDEGA